MNNQIKLLQLEEQFVATEVQIAACLSRPMTPGQNTLALKALQGFGMAEHAGMGAVAIVSSNSVFFAANTMFSASFAKDFGDVEPGDPKPTAEIARERVAQGEHTESNLGLLQLMIERALLSPAN